MDMAATARKLIAIEQILGFHLEPAVSPRVGGLAERLFRANGKTGQLIAPPLRHVTLMALGDDPFIAERIRQAVTSVARSGPFDVTFDCSMSFLNRGNHPFVLTGGAGLDRLRDFQRDLHDAIAERLPAFPAWRPYTPHMTLFYSKRMIPQRPVEPITWTVRDIALIRSYQGLGLHEVLEQWRLGEA